MRPATVLIGMGAVLFSACASAATVDGDPQPAERLSTGLVALQDAEYGIAYDHLIHVRSVCGDSPMGQQALLVLAAAELDPRNPQRQIELAGEFAAHYLSLENRAAWAEPLAQSLYLLSLEIGAADAVGTLLGYVDDESMPEAAPAVAVVGPNDTSATDPGILRAETLRRAVFGFVPEPVPDECGADWQQVGAGAMPTDLPALPLSPITDRITELEQERVDLMRRQKELEGQVETLQTELARIRETLRP